MKITPVQQWFIKHITHLCGTIRINSYNSSVISQKDKSLNGSNFFKKLAFFVFLFPPVWNSPFCLITDELSERYNKVLEKWEAIFYLNIADPRQKTKTVIKRWNQRPVESYLRALSMSSGYYTCGCNRPREDNVVQTPATVKQHNLQTGGVDQVDQDLQSLHILRWKWIV